MTIKPQMSTDSSPPVNDNSAVERDRNARRFRRNVTLAVTAVIFLPYQIWTYTAWFSAGVYSFTPTDGTEKPLVVTISEPLLALITIAAFVWVGYDAIRQRKFTFDAMILTGLVSTLFFDTNVNFVTPVFLYSSHWTNVNQWWGNAPFSMNPVGSDMVMPIFVVVGGYIGLAYWCSVIGSVLIAKVRQWKPQWSLTLVATGIFFALLVGAIPVDLALNVSHLVGTPGGVPFYDFGSDTVRFSVPETVWGPAWVTFLGLLRYTKFTSTGFDGRAISRRARTLVVAFATMGALNLSLLFSTAPWWFLSLYAEPFPENYPSHLISDVCDLPGQPPHTAYGPCPGGSGYTLPIK